MNLEELEDLRSKVDTFIEKKKPKEVESSGGCTSVKVN